MAIRALLDVLARFTFPTLAFGAVPATDLLRELYLRLVPRQLRRRLGEFPTPPWLAEACLERLAQQGAPLTWPGARVRVTSRKVEVGVNIGKEAVTSFIDTATSTAPILDLNVARGYPTCSTSASLNRGI